jgi:hypothetical protein
MLTDLCRFFNSMKGFHTVIYQFLIFILYFLYKSQRILSAANNLPCHNEDIRRYTPSYAGGQGKARHPTMNPSARHNRKPYDTR